MCVFVCVCLQEMLENGHVVTQETLHYLLMGCLKDKETGFRMALQVHTCSQEAVNGILFFIIMTLSAEGFSKVLSE